MSSIDVGSLKDVLDGLYDDYQVYIKIKHKYPISKEEGERGWLAAINGVHIDHDRREIYLMN